MRSYSVSTISFPFCTHGCTFHKNFLWFFQVNEEEISAADYLTLRTQYVQQQKDEGKAVYPHKFHVSTSLTDFITTYSNLEQGVEGKEELTVSGRVHAIRESSQKLRFYDLRGEDAKIQVNILYFS